MSFITPEQLHNTLPITDRCAHRVHEARQEIIDILNKKNNRLLVIVGPCSIHNTESALIYAKKLQTQIEKHKKTLCIVMRTYIEKARTTIGWKGFINDPDLNNSFHIKKGLYEARKLLLSINALGVPTATELLNPFTIPYFSDLLSWAAVGARTTESQIHRELASYLSIPIGFKNNTQGDIQTAIDGVQTAHQAHHFLGMKNTGEIAILQSTGNPYSHVVLRGSQHHSNYDEKIIKKTIRHLNRLNLNNRILIDCSHGNNQKNYRHQLKIIDELSQRLMQGNHDFFGMMLESHLMPGKQVWSPCITATSEHSITDACIGWRDTEIALDILSQAVQNC